MNGRRAPGSAAPRAVVRINCGPSAKPPPRITHNASPVEAGAIVGRIVGIRLIRTARPLPHVARHVRQAERAFRARELARPARCRGAEVGAIAPRLVPHGNRRRSVPRAAFSHCASVGSVTRQPSRSAWASVAACSQPTSSVGFEPAAYTRCASGHETNVTGMVGRPANRARIDVPLPRLRELRELGDRDLVAAR